MRPAITECPLDPHSRLLKAIEDCSESAPEGFLILIMSYATPGTRPLYSSLTNAFCLHSVPTIVLKVVLPCSGRCVAFVQKGPCRCSCNRDFPSALGAFTFTWPLVATFALGRSMHGKILSQIRIRNHWHCSFHWPYPITCLKAESAGH